MNFQYEWTDEHGNTYRTVGPPTVIRGGMPTTEDLHRAYMQLLLNRAWDRHSERMELEREPVAVSDARFLKALKIAPMDEQP